MGLSEYARTVLRNLKETPLLKQLKTTDAVVLERLARGGGATNWFYCPDESSLVNIVQLFRPGSVISFYFDGRLNQGVDSEDTKLKLEKLALDHGEAIVGALMADNVSIDMIVFSGIKDLDGIFEFTSSRKIFFGVFPNRENDGVNAITLALPDSDGVVRPHPH